MHTRTIQQKKKLGLALGGGGARSMAHLGIVHVLYEHNITIDSLATSSGGSLMGGLIAAGVPVDEIRRTFNLLIKRVSWFRPQVRHGGLLSQNNIRHIVNDLCGDINIEETEIPIAILATDLNRGSTKVFREGNLTDAICASSAFPGIYHPTKINGQLYADGGILNNIPADICRKDIGRENVVLAVSLDSKLNSNLGNTSGFEVVYRSIYIPLIQARENNIRENSDLVWRVFGGKDVNLRNWLDLLRFYSVKEMDYFYDLGREIAEQNISMLISQFEASEDSSSERPLQQNRDGSNIIPLSTEKTSS